MQTLNNPYDLTEINSFLHLASKDEILAIYNKYKEEWINKGVLTYYAEDFIKYQNSPKLDNSLEPYVLYIIYSILNNYGVPTISVAGTSYVGATK